MPLLKIAKAFATEEPNGQDANLIEDHQGNPHHHLVNDIGSRSENGGYDEVDQNGILAVAIEKRNIDQADLGEKNHEYRHLEDGPEGQKQAGGQGEIFAHRWQRGQIIIVVSNQKPESGRKDNQIAKSGAPDKTAGGQHDEGDQDLLFMLEQTGGDEAPDLGKDDRTGQQNTCDQGKL